MRDGRSGQPLFRIAILIPAYNAAQTIAEVVRKNLRFVPPEDIIVIDDGSHDDTGAVARSLGITVLSHNSNKGKGAALRTGFQHIAAGGFQGVIVMDADGQHDPRFIPRFFQRAAGGEHLVIGSRMGRVGRMPLLRRATNRLTSAIISGLARQKVSDSQSGYRFVHIDILRKLRLRTYGYDTESEMLIQAGRMGYRITSLPISSIYGNEKSSIKPGRDTLRFVRLVLRTFFNQ
jgi:glycosyltransferase involved in cell wall biosynthesis